MRASHLVLLLLISTGCGVPDSAQPGGAAILPQTSATPAQATRPEASTEAFPDVPATPTPTWQSVEWAGISIPLPPEAHWEPEYNRRPPAPQAWPLAQAALSYAPVDTTGVVTPSLVFVISAWGGPLQDWIAGEQQFDPRAVDDETVRDTMLGGLPAKVYRPVAAGPCTRTTYIALLPRDQLLYVAADCGDDELHQKVLHGLRLLPPDPTPIGGKPCPPPLTVQSIADYANVIQLDGIHYAEQYSVGRPVTEADLGPVHARVRCKLQDHAYDALEGMQDRYATFLNPGAPVYTVQGYRPSFRLAAKLENRWVLYEALDNPAARHGADLLDLAGHVQSIGIYRGHPNDVAPLATSSDPDEVAALVALIEAAPVDHTPQTSGSEGYSLRFTFDDGTQTHQLYESASRRLARVIVLPEEFEAALSRVLEKQQ